MTRLVWFVAVAAALSVIAVGGEAVEPAGAVRVDSCAGQERIVFAGSRFSSRAELFSANPDGSVLVEIHRSPDGDEISELAVSADGQQVAWLGRSLHVADITGADVTELESAFNLVVNSPPAWTADGQTLVYGAAFFNDRGVYAIETDGTGERRLDTNADSTDAWHPSVAPDGRVVWGGLRTGPPFNTVINTGDLVGTKPTLEDEPHRRVGLSPDGLTRIAPGASGEISIDRGLGFVPLVDATDLTNSESVVWSPDSSQVAWIASIDGVAEFQTMLINADGTGQRRLTTDDDRDLQGESWSADGTRLLAFDPARGISIIDVATGTVTDIDTSPVAEARWPRWACGPTQCPEGETPFTDLSPTSFAFDDVACIFVLGVTQGTSPTAYSPSDFVTREQMAAFLARLWRAMSRSCASVETDFTDIDGSFAQDDIACIFGLGVTQGTGPSTYAPDGLVTREQMAAFLARLWRAAGGDCAANTSPLTDVADSSFAALDVRCIYHLGITTGTSPTTYSPADNVTREQMAAFLARFWRLAVAHGLVVPA